MNRPGGFYRGSPLQSNCNKIFVHLGPVEKLSPSLKARMMQGQLWAKIENIWVNVLLFYHHKDLKIEDKNIS